MLKLVASILNHSVLGVCYTVMPGVSTMIGNLAVVRFPVNAKL